MQIDVIYPKDINKLSQAEQLAFFKNKFEVQHCREENCGCEVGIAWRLYDGTLYCERCFDFLTAKERKQAVETIQRNLAEIQELKERYQLEEDDFAE